MSKKREPSVIEELEFEFTIQQVIMAGDDWLVQQKTWTLKDVCEKQEVCRERIIMYAVADVTEPGREPYCEIVPLTGENIGSDTDGPWHAVNYWIGENRILNRTIDDYARTTRYVKRGSFDLTDEPWLSRCARGYRCKREIGEDYVQIDHTEECEEAQRAEHKARSRSRQKAEAAGKEA
jgi:hypothetical protein